MSISTTVSNQSTLHDRMINLCYFLQGITVIIWAQTPMMMWWEATHLSSLKYPPQALPQSSIAESTTPTPTSIVISMVTRTSRTARGLRSRHRPADTSMETQLWARATLWMPFSSWMDDHEGKLRRTRGEAPKGTPAASAAKPTPRPPTWAGTNRHTGA